MKARVLARYGPPAGGAPAGLERATLQPDNFCMKSAVVALQAGGLERDTARPPDSELRHDPVVCLLLIHISEPTRLLSTSYAVFLSKK